MNSELLPLAGSASGLLSAMLSAGLSFRLSASEDTVLTSEVLSGRLLLSPPSPQAHIETAVTAHITKERILFNKYITSFIGCDSLQHNYSISCVYCQQS